MRLRLAGAVGGDGDDLVHLGRGGRVNRVAVRTIGGKTVGREYDDRGMPGVRRYPGASMIDGPT